MKRSGWLCALVVTGSALATGCDATKQEAAAVDAPYRSPQALHPAMAAKTSGSAASPAGGSASRAQGSATMTPPPARSSQPPGGGGSSGGLAVGLARAGLAADIPPAWIEQPSSSQMRLATIRLPRIEGDTKDGEMSVIQLPGGAGGLQANIQRWEGQFQEKPKAITESMETGGGVKVTTVEIEGTFSPGGGPMMRTSGGPISGALLLGAIVELPSGAGLLFFKGWGPKATMEHWRESFQGFVQSLRRAN